MEKTLYHRLARRRFTGFKFHELYLGPDHLLSVDSCYIFERYHRFYMRDIQGFVVRQTPAGLVWSILFGVVTVVLLATAASSQQAAALWAAGIPALLLCINLLRGPTCQTEIFTAANRMPLRSLDRLKRTRRVLKKLRPLIEEAQGKVEQDQIEQALPSLAQLTEPPMRNSGATAESYNGFIHKLLFATITGCGLLILCDIPIDHVALTLATVLLFMGAVVLTILTIIRNYQLTVVPRMVKAATWGACGFLTLEFVVGYIIFFAAVLVESEQLRTQWDQLVTFTALSAREHSPLLVTLAILGGLGFFIGMAGTILSFLGFQHRSR